MNTDIGMLVSCSINPEGIQDEIDITLAYQTYHRLGSRGGRCLLSLSLRGLPLSVEGPNGSSTCGLGCKRELRFGLLGLFAVIFDFFTGSVPLVISTSCLRFLAVDECSLVATAVGRDKASGVLESRDCEGEIAEDEGEAASGVLGKESRALASFI